MAISNALTTKQMENNLNFIGGVYNLPPYLLVGIWSNENLTPGQVPASNSYTGAITPNSSGYGFLGQNAADLTQYAGIPSSNASSILTGGTPTDQMLVAKSAAAQLKSLGASSMNAGSTATAIEAYNVGSGNAGDPASVTYAKNATSVASSLDKANGGSSTVLDELGAIIGMNVAPGFGGTSPVTGALQGANAAQTTQTVASSILPGVATDLKSIAIFAGLIIVGAVVFLVGGLSLVHK